MISFLVKSGCSSELLNDEQNDTPINPSSIFIKLQSKGNYCESHVKVYSAGGKVLSVNFLNHWQMLSPKICLLLYECFVD